jgi:hypothetical protein
MEIKTFVVTIPRSQIEKAYDWLKYEDMDECSSSVLAQWLVKAGVQYHFQLEGVFTSDIRIEGIDFNSDLEGFENALALVKKLLKNIVFKATFITGAARHVDGLYLSMADFKGEAKNLLSNLRLNSRKDTVYLHVYSPNMAKRIREAKDGRQTFNEWLSLGLKQAYPKVSFIARPKGDPMAKDEMLKTLMKSRELYITLKRGIAENWVIEGI